MLISTEQHWRTPAKNQEEEPGNKITGLARKKLMFGKTETYLDKPGLGLKRMIVREQENIFLFEFGLIVSAVLKCLF